jgi:nitrate reductase (NAD(P)H)
MAPDIGFKPDAWIQRSQQLVTNTGDHPFNAEQNFDDLLQNEFTPSALHYVRNHGDVPKLSWDEHKLELLGVPSTDTQKRVQITVSMPELVATLPSVEIPLTFACDGNRRKEVNALQRSQGFDWGPTAVSTSVYKGKTHCPILILGLSCFMSAIDQPWRTYLIR